MEGCSERCGIRGLSYSGFAIHFSLADSQSSSHIEVWCPFVLRLSWRSVSVYASKAIPFAVLNPGRGGAAAAAGVIIG